MLIFFRHVEDVDLFVGSNHENHLPGALVGPVSACIIGEQMKHLKFGDRFFYTHQGQFTAGKKGELNGFNEQNLHRFAFFSLQLNYNRSELIHIDVSFVIQLISKKFHVMPSNRPMIKRKRSIRPLTFVNSQLFVFHF